MRVDENVPLSEHTTLCVGGLASGWVETESEEELAGVLLQAESNKIPVLILGGGSNVVVSDEGWPGIVVRVAHRGVTTVREGAAVRVSAAAGEDWDSTVAWAVSEGFSGIECLSGIPGWVGATPIQNVGAYGQEAAQVIARVRAFDRDARAFVDLPPWECGFAYRDSRFKRTAQFVVTEVEYLLIEGGLSAPLRYPELARALGVEMGASAPLLAVRESVLALRRQKAMVLDPSDPDSVSAGSFFTNPRLSQAAFARLDARARTGGLLGEGESLPSFPGEGGEQKVPAAWLIERAGFAKGWGMGEVGISRKHALALVNRGHATAAQIVEVARIVAQGVYDRFGVRLTPEPVFVGMGPLPLSIDGG